MLPPFRQQQPIVIIERLLEIEKLETLDYMSFGKVSASGRKATNHDTQTKLQPGSIGP